MRLKRRQASLGSSQSESGSERSFSISEGWEGPRFLARGCFGLGLWPGGSEDTAYEKGGVGNGKPDPPKHTIYRGRPHLKNPRYSGFQGLLGVSCLSLQRLGSSVWFGTRTRVAPKNNLRALRATCRESRDRDYEG